MELVLTIALSGLGTAEKALRRQSSKETDAKKKKNLLKVAAALKAAADGINSLLEDGAFN
jgi:hypothetical protein